MLDVHGPKGSLEELHTTLAELKQNSRNGDAEPQQKGPIRHLGSSNATGIVLYVAVPENAVVAAKQVAGLSKISPVVCLQNLCNLAQRDDDTLVDDLAAKHIAYVPVFPLGGSSPLQSGTLSEVSPPLGATPLQVAPPLGCIASRASCHLGTASVAHLRDNLAVADLKIARDQLAVLDRIARERPAAAPAP